MPLPTLSVPKYQVTIPSTKKVTNFRPFLVKEQKILLMALESADNVQILSAISEIVKNCVDGIEDPMKMAIFDLEYLFAKIRAKSVGEQIDARTKCPKCGKVNAIEVDLDHLEVRFPENSSNKIMLSDTMGMLLNYPSLDKANLDLSRVGTEELIRFIADSIETIFDMENMYSRKDFTTEEAVKFVESMTADQFERVGKFYQSVPHLHKEVVMKCIGCGEETNIEFRGLQDFFT